MTLKPENYSPRLLDAVIERRLRDKVAANPAARNREPSFLAVLVGKAAFCRQTPEGVYVIPITSLGA